MQHCILGLVLTACTQPLGYTAKEEQVSDSASPPVTYACVDGQVSAEAPPAEQRGDFILRAVQIETPHFDPLCARVSVSTAEPIYEEGRPVLVGAFPSLLPEPFDDAPGLMNGAGVVEVVAVPPGSSLLDCQTAGEPDLAGEGSVLATAEVIRFALGEGYAQDGLRIQDLVDGPLCTGRVVVASSSGGAATVTAAVAQLEDLPGTVDALALAEPMTSPFFVNSNAGIVTSKGDLDCDGNGRTWDDWRNPGMSDEDCVDGVCAIDFSSLTWGGSGSTFAAWLQFEDHGRDQGEGCPPDPWPFSVSRPEDPGLEAAMEGVRVTPDVLAALHAAGLQDGEWGTPTAAEVEQWWAPRDMVGRLPDTATSQPGLVVHMTFGAEPHAVPWASQPHIRVAVDAAREAGLSFRVHPDPAFVACMGDDTMAALTGEGPGIDEAPGWQEYEALALDPAVPYGSLLALAAGQALWDAHGPFDTCPHVLLTEGDESASN